MKNSLEILYIEDDPMSSKVMAMCLKTSVMQSHLTVFPDSNNFLDRVQMLDPRPDIIFLDIHVKPHNGFDMLKMLREIEPFREVPIVALTASVMNEEVHLLKTSGFDGCFSKPLDIETFPDNLHRIVNGEHIWRVS
jgi:two-component system cell cycle response regulator DivK